MSRKNRHADTHAFSNTTSMTITELQDNLKIDPATGSHPLIRFEQVPIVKGALTQLSALRPALLKDVVERTLAEFSSKTASEKALGETLYAERRRLSRASPTLFTRGRYRADQQLIQRVYSDFLRPNFDQEQRHEMLSSLVSHFAEEIGGYFNPRIYRAATKAVPWGFSWLLNAASVRHFLPWGMTESLQSRLHIVGEIPLIQKLAKIGTILLVPTHQSHLDSVLNGYVVYLMSLPAFAYGAGLNLFTNPLLSYSMSQLGSYTVDRQKNHQLYKTTLKNYSTRILEEGIHSIFFPGGSRSRSGAIESRLKLGLLGSALDAEIYGLKKGGPARRRVFIVPMVMSYHFVLEASTLIEDYLAESGKHRFIPASDDFLQSQKILAFFWKLFSTQSAITMRVGRALDVFGNFVDETGRSLGPNGCEIHPEKWLTTRGVLGHEPQRDHEYTAELGVKLVDRFHKENTVLSSHLVAFSFFEMLRRKYPEYDLYRFLRLSHAQRAVPYADFLENAEKDLERLTQLAQHGQLFLASDLVLQNTLVWAADGVKQLGQLHDAAVIRVEKGIIRTEDLNLLYYYRNRLSGYGLSLRARASSFHPLPLGNHDDQGFLA